MLGVAGTLADWFAAAIITRHPLLQVFLSPRIRYLALASNSVGMLPFFVVGFLRLVLTDPLYYLLGRWYGDDALGWADRNWGGSSHSVRIIERWFARAAYPIVAVAPNGLVCLLAGATGMPPVPFAVLNVTGTMARLVIIRAFAAALEGPLEALVGFIDRYQWWIVAVSVAVGLVQLRRSRRPRGAEMSPAGPGTTAGTGDDP